MAMPTRGSSGRHPQRPPSRTGDRSAARQLPGQGDVRGATHPSPISAMLSAKPSCAPPPRVETAPEPQASPAYAPLPSR
eukprot:3962714-Prymnesium_polylepis.1